MLDEHRVAGMNQRFAVYWEKADAILIVLNLLRHTDDHRLTVAVGRSWPATSMRTRAGSFWPIARWARSGRVRERGKCARKTWRSRSLQTSPASVAAASLLRWPWRLMM